MQIDIKYWLWIRLGYEDWNKYTDNTKQATFVISFVADEDLCGRNVLLLTSFLLHELLRYLRENVQVLLCHYSH